MKKKTKEDGVDVKITKDDIQQQALSTILANKRCTCALSMGVGKTRIAIQHFQKSYNPFIKALVVIPKLSIKESWLAELKKLGIEIIKMPS